MTVPPRFCHADDFQPADLKCGQFYLPRTIKAARPERTHPTLSAMHLCVKAIHVSRRGVKLSHKFGALLMKDTRRKMTVVFQTAAEQNPSHQTLKLLRFHLTFV